MEGNEDEIMKSKGKRFLCFCPKIDLSKLVISETIDEGHLLLSILNAIVNRNNNDTSWNATDEDFMSAKQGTWFQAWVNGGINWRKMNYESKLHFCWTIDSMSKPTEGKIIHVYVLDNDRLTFLEILAFWIVSQLELSTELAFKIRDEWPNLMKRCGLKEFKNFSRSVSNIKLKIGSYIRSYETNWQLCVDLTWPIWYAECFRPFAKSVFLNWMSSFY